MKHGIIYIASPYSHINPEIVENNYKKVAKFSAKLVSEGYTAISPIAYAHTLLPFVDMPSDWEFWLNFCLTLLSKSDALYVYKMEGWDKSCGVTAEIAYAKEHDIPIRYVKEID